MLKEYLKNKTIEEVFSKDDSSFKTTSSSHKHGLPPSDLEVEQETKVSSLPLDTNNNHLIETIDNYFELFYKDLRKDAFAQSLAYPSDLEKGYTITELSDCLLKVYFLRKQKELIKRNIFFINENNVFETIQLYAIKGTATHKFVEEKLKKILSNKLSNDILLEPSLSHEELNIRGRADIICPDQKLIIELKSKDKPCNPSTSDGLQYKIQLYLQMYLARNGLVHGVIDENTLQKIRQVQYGVLWFFFPKKYYIVEWDEVKVQGLIDRIKLLSTLLSLPFQEVVSLRKDSLKLLMNKSFCFFCIIDHTCKKILS